MLRHVLSDLLCEETNSGIDKSWKTKSFPLVEQLFDHIATSLHDWDEKIRFP